MCMAAKTDVFTYVHIFWAACRWFAQTSQTWGWGMYNLGITLSVITHFKSNTAVFSLILVYFAWKLCNHEKNKWFWIKLICLLSITLPIIFSVNWLVYNIITNHIFSKPSWHLQMSCFVQLTITGTTTPNSQLYIYWLKTICFSSRFQWYSMSGFETCTIDKVQSNYYFTLVPMSDNRNRKKVNEGD